MVFRQRSKNSILSNLYLGPTFGQKDLVIKNQCHIEKNILRFKDYTNE